jgi:hypothetical protein
MPITAHLVQCSQCGKTAIVTEGENVHDALDCKCCPSSTHTHADENGATQNPCRSVHISANAVVVPAISIGG